ncbi:MAG TPA: TylF/MycF/NovP-related O-methyltransferase [Acetobacteraceae bacterium]|nr:TylF/MycF/NovP-related O-methyltransferase [Acetobacteraceae bacterium]
MQSISPARWPAWCGDAFEIKVPANVRRQPVSSPEGGANINVILALLERTAGIPGAIAECGVFRGSTLIPIALQVRAARLGKQVFGFDSFEGFDDTIRVDLELGGAADLQKREGGFNQTSLGYVASRIAALGLDRQITLLKGYFEQTLPRAPETRYSFVHLDCDIYGSYRQCLEHFYPRMTAGGIILFDEYNDPPWPGCNKAIDEFLSDRPERPVLIERDGYQKYYIEKAG